MTRGYLVNPVLISSAVQLHLREAPDCSDLAIAIVTYQPDLDVLGAQQAALPPSALKVVVDNASSPAITAKLRALCDSLPHSILIENGINRGLPAAINQAVHAALTTRPRCRYVLFLDQDTEPDERGVPDLLRWFEELRDAGFNPGCVGPRLIDVQSGLEHGFHQIAGLRWVRCFPQPDGAPVECKNLNCSGTLLSMELFLRLGGLEEGFFIDHLDTEWAFRVLSAGYGLYGIPAVVFRHRMGQKTWRIWLGKWRVWPYRAPARHYFLYRNTLWLIKRKYVPGVWKFWAAVKLLVTALVHLVADPLRWQQLRSMSRGLLHGLRSTGNADSSSSHFL